ncbi:MAG: hypothetical protein R6W91_05020 [Thermoplasmata archaeon]
MYGDDFVNSETSVKNRKKGVASIVVVIIVILSIYGVYNFYNNGDTEFTHKYNDRILSLHKSNESTIKNLTFEISIDEEFEVSDEIIVSCKFTNIANNQTSFYEPDLSIASPTGFVPSLNFFIFTPNETIIYYIGGLNLIVPPIITLAPHETYERNETLHGVWGSYSNRTDYTFPPGSYELFGNYSSVGPLGNEVWLRSNLAHFEILEVDN